MKINEVLSGEYVGCKMEIHNEQVSVVVQNPNVDKIEKELTVLKQIYNKASFKESIKMFDELQIMKKELAAEKRKPNHIYLNKVNLLTLSNADKNISTSSSSAIVKGAVGGALLGVVGLLAAVGAKKKNYYTLVVEWRDGNKSVISVNEKFYQILLVQI